MNGGRREKVRKVSERRKEVGIERVRVVSSRELNRPNMTWLSTRELLAFLSSLFLVPVIHLSIHLVLSCSLLRKSDKKSEQAIFPSPPPTLMYHFLLSLSSSSSPPPPLSLNISKFSSSGYGSAERNEKEEKKGSFNFSESLHFFFPSLLYIQTKYSHSPSPITQV